MLWILQFILRHKNLASLLLTVLLSLWMLTADALMQQKITRTLTLSIFFPFQFTIQKVTEIRNLYTENKLLREELAADRISLSMLAEQALENRRLRDLLGFDSCFTYGLLPARVIAREPSPLFRSIVINAGRQHNLERYMPVVTKDGVLGKIIQVMPNISLVQLLRDPSARTSVMVKRSRVVGILGTESGRRFSVRHRTFTDVQEGDTIITSGLGGIYPKGLTVGVVEKVEEKRDPLFHKIHKSVIMLAADFERTEEVFVIRLSPRWSALREELDSLEYEE